MGFIDRLLGRKPGQRHQHSIRVSQAQSSQSHPAGRDASRRELVAMAVSDALRKSGIPPTWITAETFPVMTAQRQRGMHLRLLVREWQPTLLDYGAALQKLIRMRVSRLDPLSSLWLTDVTWKFDLVDDANCPMLPAPVYWQGIGARSNTAPAKEQAGSLKARRAALDQLLAGGGDAASGGNQARHDGFSPTQPMLNY